MSKQERFECYASIQSDCIRGRGFYQVIFTIFNIHRVSLGPATISLAGHLASVVSTAQGMGLVSLVCLIVRGFQRLIDLLGATIVPCGRIRSWIHPLIDGLNRCSIKKVSKIRGRLSSWQSMEELARTDYINNKFFIVFP